MVRRAFSGSPDARRLKRNYGESIDGNVSRQALYASYSAACERLSVRPVNPAAFGRSVRSTFQGAFASLTAFREEPDGVGVSPRFVRMS